MISVTDDQRRALERLSAKTGRSMSDLNREALVALLADYPEDEEVAQAS